MSFFRKKMGRKDLGYFGDIDVVDCLCWQVGLLIMMVVMGVLLIRMITVSVWLSFQLWSNLIASIITSILGGWFWIGLIFLTWGLVVERALVNIPEGRGSGILFMILPALSATPLIVLRLLSWWWGRDVVVADPLIVYYTTLAVLLLVLPPTGIRWRRKGEDLMTVTRSLRRQAMQLRRGLGTPAAKELADALDEVAALSESGQHMDALMRMDYVVTGFGDYRLLSKEWMSSTARRLAEASDKQIESWRQAGN